MIVVTGDLWSEIKTADVVLVTTNAIINKQGRLVMGRGAALEAATRYPALSFELAEKIKLYGNKPYGVIVLRPYAHGANLGIFQVKYHFKDNADLFLITNSAKKLGIIAEAFPDMRFAMNYPGIGYGRLKVSDVEPILTSHLPDNVFVYKKEEECPLEN